ncbi:serine hydrolase [Dactylosporangium vinaceum]|uniref:Serine hydrolase n=1 Tax=Dactylosporangium vinaceum TaxID=53362 RepID=A0ABV5MCZ5_9ACTN|nr:serine hydrolase [Dactylosporangium vinaceum]UAC00788.1 serine hydrolase [Dactylosporangium vinaceum]
MLRRIAVAAALVALLLGLPAAAAAAGPGPAAQFTWLVDASARPPVAAAELQQHLSAPLLAAVGGPDGFNAVLRQVGPLTPGAVVYSTATELRQVATGPGGPLLVRITVDAAGLIGALLFTPYPPAPASWEALDDAARALAPRVSFAAARITPAGCALVHGLDPSTARPLGSAFKLYVLGALAQAVHDGRLRWDTKLALNPAWKSLPSGVLQDQPDGAVYTLEQYADYMISISDNTATDHLIHQVGRTAVQRQFRRFGNDAPNLPVLTTRELFALKSWHYPAVATAYASLPPALRAITLPLLGQVPRTGLGAWTQPEMIDQLEWFGSPMDMCEAFAGLRAQGDPHVGAALSINDGGIGLSPAGFPTVWFKGGSEPGVLTLNYLAQAADGTLVTASLMLSDPAAPLRESATLPALALLRGALQLAAR